MRLAGRYRQRPMGRTVFSRTQFCTFITIFKLINQPLHMDNI